MVRSVDRETSVEDVVRNSSIEIIPIKGAEEKASAVPSETTVTITCSPRFGLARTLAHVEEACRSGHRVVPHLAARMVEDRRELREFVRQVTDLGVEDLYVVGGDGEEPVGAFAEAAEILQELAEFDHGLTRLGVGCYPEGHPKIADDVLFDALVRKQQFADYMVSQLCFDAAAMVGWLRSARERGITLPLRVGLAAPVQTRKLIELSVKIGVGQSIRFLSKQHGLFNNLLLGRAYEPMDLLLAIRRETSFDAVAIEGVHLFSFNQVDATLDWLRRARGAEKVG